MSAETALLARTWPVGSRTCTLTVPRPKPGAVINASAEWSPNEPSRLSTDEWRQYRLGRNQALAEIAAEIGLTIGVLEC